MLVLKMQDKEDPTVAFTVTVDRDKGQKGEKMVFPPPNTWYRSSVAAARDDMWAYASSNMIVLVKRCVEEQEATAKETCPDFDKRPPNANIERLAEQKSRSETSRKWPTFTMVGEQTNKKYNCVSFCQSSWDYLPVPGAPLVSGCEGGFVRVWNLEQNAAVIYHDNHSSQQVTGLDWSLRDPSIIYSIDDAGTMTVWNVKQNTLRSLNFGKVVPTSLQACPQLDNVVSFGTKGGNVFIVETGGNGKILAKVRHDEEVVVTAWKPIGDWFTLESYKCDTKGPVVVSSTHAMKLPTIRIWNSNGQDLGTLQAWEKDPKQRAFKIFGPAAWGRDPHSGSLVLFSSARHGEIISWTSSRVHDIVHTVHGHNAIFAMVQCGDILWTMSYEPIIVGWNLRTSQIECIVPTFKGACTVAASPIDNSRLAIGGTDSVIRVLKCSDGYPSEGDGCAIAPLNSNKLKGKITAIAWHPGKDNCLGLGTDEGVLGIFELKENNRHAMMFDRRVNGTVYTVNFGPSVYHADYKVPKQEQPVSSEESDKSGGNAEKVTDKERFMLYACGGSAVYMIHPSRPSNPLLSVFKIIEKSNPDESKECTSADYRQLYKASDIRWSPDFSYLAVGYVDGRIELYSAPNLKIKCWIKCHLRAIQYLSWRPFDFCTKSEAEKTNDRWLASTSNDGTTRLYNLKELFEKEIQESETSEPSMIISSEATFQGHGVRVISCAWSPHDKNLLVTVAYDCTAIVWNMEDGSHLARYMGHKHRLVACCFHPTDKFKLITISDQQSRDFAIHVWDYREHPFRQNLPRSRPAGMAVPVNAFSEIGMKVGTRINDEDKSKDVVLVKNQGEIHSIKKAVDAIEQKGKEDSSLFVNLKVGFGRGRPTTEFNAKQLGYHGLAKLAEKEFGVADKRPQELNRNLRKTCIRNNLDMLSDPPNGYEEDIRDWRFDDDAFNSVPTFSCFSNEMVKWIEDETSLLQQLQCINFSEAKIVGLDFEFHNRDTYDGFICVASVSTPKTTLVIDSIYRSRDSTILNLREIIESHDVLKVFCGCDNDISRLKKDWNCFSKSVIDVQDMFKVWKTTNFEECLISCESALLERLKMKKIDSNPDILRDELLRVEQPGLDFLVAIFFKKETSKNYIATHADWRARPLHPTLLEYAAKDSYYALKLFYVLFEKIGYAGLKQAYKRAIPKLLNTSKLPKYKIKAAIEVNDVSERVKKWMLYSTLHLDLDPQRFLSSNLIAKFCKEVSCVILPEGMNILIELVKKYKIPDDHQKSAKLLSTFLMNDQSEFQKMKTIICRDCGEQGHTGRFCPNPANAEARRAYRLLPQNHEAEQRQDDRRRRKWFENRPYLDPATDKCPWEK